jgi:hypothetical protein
VDTIPDGRATTKYQILIWTSLVGTPIRDPHHPWDDALRVAISVGESRQSMPKQTLRDLSRVIPTSEDFTRIDAEVATAPDRHFVLMLALEVENTLRYAITSVLPNNDRSIIDKMMDRDGVLSNFSRKIDLGYALALYEKQMHKDLTIIRNIRNSFAHTLIAITLDTPQVSNEVIKLRTGEPDNTSDTTNRDRFWWACKRILIELLDILKNRGKGQILIGED